MIKLGESGKNAKKRIQCRITGRVQMVMFRDFTCRKARKLRLTGTVQNERDGSVRVVAEGEEDQLQKLIGLLHRGSVLSRVDDVEVEWLPATGEFLHFRIVFPGKEGK
ncbi:MAG TPA: acylphosphatase [Candidatus Paceibacterota bacterium]|nr:acylphosphatase [Candidatus Paceibacterota bacterium]